MVSGLDIDQSRKVLRVQSGCDNSGACWRSAGSIQGWQMAIVENNGKSRALNGQELKVVSLTVADSVAGVVRECIQRNAQEFVTWALHHEFDRFLLRFRNGDEPPAVVRNGFQPARQIMTGLGLLTVRYPKARSRVGGAPSFRSQLVPKYAHRARDSSDGAEWDCLDAVVREDLAGVLRAVFGNRSDHVRLELPSLAVQWSNMVRKWKRRSLLEHCNQPLWMVTVAPSTRSEGDNSPMHVAIAADERGLKRIVGIGSGDDSPTKAWQQVVADLQGQGLKCPAHIFSNWTPDLLREGLEQLEPRWAAQVVRSGSEWTDSLKYAASTNSWEWSVPVHQN
jgi:hypothetical protein